MTADRWAEHAATVKEALEIAEDHNGCCYRPDPFAALAEMESDRAALLDELAQLEVVRVDLDTTMRSLAADVCTRVAERDAAIKERDELIADCGEPWFEWRSKFERAETRVEQLTEATNHVVTCSPETSGPVKLVPFAARCLWGDYARAVRLLPAMRFCAESRRTLAGA